MPEGDTVHKLAAAIRSRLMGKVIRDARVRVEPRGAFQREVASAPKYRDGDCDGRLIGRRVEAVYALGKHLFLELDHGELLRSHLGMYGSWHRYRPQEVWKKPEWQASLAIWTDHDVVVCFNAKEMQFLASGGIQHTNLTHRLGPDLLSPDLELGQVVQRARELLDGHVPLADVLLEQRVACGVGNVFKSEVLFIERMHPLDRLVDTPDQSLERLYASASHLLGRNLGGGRRVTRFVYDGRGFLWVYGRRDGRCLVCGSRLRSARLGKTLRITYWCPGCQASAED